MAEVRPAGYLQIGPYELGAGTKARCVVAAKPQGKGKVDKKVSDGKSGAVVTWKGAECAEWEFDLEWNAYDTEADEAIEEALYQLGPYGPNPGKAWGFASKRARVYGTSDVIVDDIKGPIDKPGTALVTATIKATSWTKPAATAKGQGTAKTADKSQQWVPTQGSKGTTGKVPDTVELGKTGNKVGGMGPDTPGAPTVKP